MSCSLSRPAPPCPGCRTRQPLVTPPPQKLNKINYLAALQLLLLVWAVGLTSSALAQSPPGHVGSVTLTRADGTVTASWNAVAGATRYHVTYTTDDGKSWHAPVNDHTNVPTNTLTFSADNTLTYIVGVRAGNDDDQWSGWVNSAPAGPYTPVSSPPALPSGLAANAGDYSVTLSWTNPHNPSITRYEYQVNHNDTGTGNLTGWSQWAEIPGSHALTTSHTFSGLTTGKEYRYKIRAVNGEGESEPAPNADPWYISASPYGPPPPPAVTEFWVERICDHHLRVRWKWVDGATGYDLNISLNHRKSWKRLLTNQMAWGYQANHWSVNKTFWFAVRAVNAGGESAWTNVQSIAPPCKPDTIQARWTNATIAVTWSAGKRTTGYDLNISEDNGKSWTRLLSNTDSTAYTHLIEDLDYADRYLFAVRSRNGALESPWRNSAAVAPATTPTLTVSKVKRSSATLTLAGHTAQWWYQGNQSGAQCVYVGENTATADLTGLTPQTSYVYTTYSDGNCSAVIAATSTFTTPLAGLSISKITKTTARLTITGHTTTWWLKRTQPADTNCKSKGTDTVENLANLNYGTDYTYKAYDDSACQSEIASESFRTDGFSVSNLSQTAHSEACLPGWSDSTPNYCAVAFTAGNQSGGYTLESITADFAAATGTPGDIIVALHEPDATNTADPADNPVATLSGSDPDTAGQYTYTCPTTASKGCDLRAGSTYFIVISTQRPEGGTSYYNLKTTTADTEAVVPAGNGWSIANAGTSKPGSLSWRAFSDSRTPLISINALNPTVRMNVERSGTTSANLNIENYTTAWWYERTAPSGDTTCHSVAAGTTSVALTGIVNNTAYTYQAYDTAGCDSDALIATLSFTPKPLYVSGIGATIADLSFTGQSGNWYYQANKAPHTTCQGPVSGSDKALTGLAKNTAYVYTVYSDTTCATSVTSVSFTTLNPTLTASAVTHNSANIKLTGWKGGTGAGKDGSWYYRSDKTAAGRCFGPLAGSDLPVSGLSASTKYIYKAYSDAFCSNVIAAADEFTTLTPALSIDEITYSGVNLNITNHTDDWWYDRTAPANDTTCHKVSAGTSTVTLSGLVNATNYTYKAYRLSGCVAAHVMASTSFLFTAPVITSGSITPNATTLTIANYTGNWYYKANAGPHTTCSAAQSGTSANLTGLNADTEYVYTTYTDSNCSKPIASAATRFNTPHALGSRDASKDISTPIAGTNIAEPKFITTDGTTLWVTETQEDALDDAVTKLHAYNLATKDRDTSKDINLYSGNGMPRGITTDGTTMWVVDETDRGIYSYNLATKARGPAIDLSGKIGTGFNLRPRSIATDGTTLWVAETKNDAIFAFNLSTRSRDASKDIRTNTLRGAQNDDITGIYTDGTNLYVADSADDKIYAYSLSNRNWNIGKDFNTLSAAGNNNPADIASDGTTMWVVDATDNKVYAYKMSDRTRDAGKDFGATELVISAANYEPYGIWSNGTTIWVSSDTESKLYAYDLTSGRHSPAKNFSNIKVKADTTPRDIGSDGTTMWIVDGTHDKLYAYTLSTKARDSSKDFNTLTAAGNTAPTGIVTDGTTMWVADITDKKLYAYNKSTKARDSSKDFNTLRAAHNLTPSGMFMDSTTMWVVDNGTDKLYAYNKSTKARDPGKDFNTLSAAGNQSPRGVWTDGTTMWVADEADKKLYAYHSFKPYLTVGNITTTSATLTYPGKSGTWYYQANTGPHTSCTSSATASATLTGLTAGINYRYTAYTNANCTGTAATTEASFSTPASGSAQGASADTTTTPPLGSRNQAAEITLTLGPTGVTAPAPRRPGYVSNLSSARSGDSDIDTAHRQAVRFTTGPNPTGYTLTRFTAALRKLSGTADLILTLHAGTRPPNGADPQPAETVLATLTGSDPTAGAFTAMPYTCAGVGCHLTPDTTYFVVAESLGPGAYAWATIVSADLLTQTTEPVNSGWAIGPGHYADDTGEWTNWGDWHHARVDFAAPPP